MQVKNNWPIKKIGEVCIVIFLLAILAIPFLYVLRPNLIQFLPQPSNTFWDNSIGNFLATVLALIGGILIALWIDRIIKKREELLKYKWERSRESQILFLIKEELDFNLNSLFLKGKKGNTSTMTVQPLKSDLWDSLVSSEETKYTEDLNLLNRISAAYYMLKTVKNIELQAYIALRTSPVSFTINGVKKTSAQLLVSDARGLDNLFESSTKEAIRYIDKRLKELRNNEK